MMAKLFIGRVNTITIGKVSGILFLRLLSKMPSTVVIGILGITVLQECGIQVCGCITKKKEFRMQIPVAGQILASNRPGGSFPSASQARALPQ